MGAATIFYTKENGNVGFAVANRILYVEGTEIGRDCEIHLDTGEIVHTNETLQVLRDRVEVASLMRARQTKLIESER
jgi:hypothetical protein